MSPYNVPIISDYMNGIEVPTPNGHGTPNGLYQNGRVERGDSPRKFYRAIRSMPQVGIVSLNKKRSGLNTDICYWPSYCP